MEVKSEHRTLLNKIASVEKLIGKTPLVSFSSFSKNPKVQIWAKLEWQQFGGSVKARPAFNIIKQAVLNNELDENRHLLDATSGNTGLAYAAIAARLGIPVTLCLPENASKERKQMLKSLGVNLVLTSPFGGTDDAQIKAKELKAADPDHYFYADQYANQNNWKAHYHTTAEEIWQQTNGAITHFIAGLGTSGTFTGVTKKLREKNSAIEFIALQPDIAMHMLEGWKHMETAIVPKIYDPSLANRIVEIDSNEVEGIIRQAAHNEGFLVSPSAAANLLGAAKLAEELEEGIIVTVLADDASKYSEVMNRIFQ